MTVKCDKALSTLFVLLIIAFIPSTLFSFEIRSAKDSYCVGEKISVFGKIPERELSAYTPEYIYINDPVTRICARLEIDDNLTFSYTTSRPISAEGLYGFKFTLPTDSDPVEKYLVISAMNCGADENSYYLMSLEDFDISLGIHDDGLDEETDVLTRQFTTGESDLNALPVKSYSWKDFYLESLVETTTDWFDRFKENLTSPSSIAVYAGAGVFCAATGPGGCVLAMSFVAKELLAKSIWTDLEFLLDEAICDEMDEGDREEIKNWSKMGYSTIITLVSLSSDGGLLDATSFVGTWGELAWEGRPEIKMVSRTPGDAVSSFVVYIQTKEGDLIAYRVSRTDGSLPEDVIPRNTIYLDTEIVMKDGDRFLCTTISGSYNGYEYGMPDRSRKNYFIIKDLDDNIRRIPIHEIDKVERQVIRITSIDGYTVTLDKGTRHRISEDAVFSVYRPYKDIITHQYEETFIGTIQVQELFEDRASALIAAHYKSKPFRTGYICR